MSIIGEAQNLSDDQCNDIFKVIPSVNAGIKDIAEKTREEIIFVQKQLLKELKVHPNSIEELKREILNHFRRSTVEPGLPVGLLTGEALGSQATQGVLNTFHHAGLMQTVGSGTTGELLNATQYRKNESTILHFKNHDMSFEDVLEYQRIIIGVNIHMLCISSQLIITKNHKKEWWYDLYKNIYNFSEESSDHFLRLYFDINYLYKFKVNLQDIIKKLETNGSGSNAAKVLICIPSPINKCIIDIYPVKNLMKEILVKNLDTDNKDIANAINDKNSSVLFLETIIKPNLSNIIVKGIPNIKKIFPVTLNTVSIISKIVKEPTESGEAKNSENTSVKEHKNSENTSVKEAKNSENKSVKEPKDGKNSENTSVKDPKNSENTSVKEHKNSENTIFEKDQDKKNIFRIWIDLIKIRTTGIPLVKLVTFLEEAKCIILNKKQRKHKLSAFEKADLDKNDILICKEGEKKNYIIAQFPENWEEKEDYKNPMDLFSDNVKNEVALSYINTINEIDGNWTIVYNGQVDEKSISKITEMVKSYNIEILNTNSNFMQIKMHENWEKNKYKTPEDFFVGLMEKEKLLADDFIRKEKLNGKIYPIYNYSKLYVAGVYNYAELVGNNLKEILSLDVVDSSKTICNSPHDIFHTFGIESARNFIAHTFFELIQNSGSYVNYRYTDFVADFMCNLSYLVAITSKGVIKHNRGALADATFQEPLTRFISSALFGGKENIESTSASIFTGTRMKLGTGYTQFALNNSVIDALKKVDISDLLVKDLKQLEEDENFTRVEQSMDYGEDNMFGDLDDINLSKTNFIVTNPVDILKIKKTFKGAPKGPIPEIRQILGYVPEFLEKIIEDVKETTKFENLPFIGHMNINSILKSVVKKISNKETEVQFFDTNFLRNNIKTHLNLEKDQDSVELGTNSNSHGV